MDQKELQEKIALYYSKLPPDAQALFSSMSWLQTIETISQKYGLDEKQKETLGTETTLVLLGIVHLVEYEETLTKELGLSADSAKKMLGEIEESIMRTIRPQLIATFEENKKSVEEIEQNPDRRFGKIPNETESAVEKSNYKAIIYTIAKAYNLTVTQIGTLETAVNDLITGATHPEDFQNFLEKNMKLPLEKVRKISNDINEEILRKIRGELIKNTERKMPEEERWQNINDTHILDSAGIKVVPPLTKAIDVRMEELQSREEMLNKIEAHPILAQKLSKEAKVPTVKTEHTLDNLTSINKISDVPKVDPYREIPE